MSYAISHFDGKQFSPAINVADGTIDTSLDLKIIGKSYAGYGLAQNENFVYLLENFANKTPPPKPISGQIWFDNLSNKIKFYDANKTWRTMGGATSSGANNKPTNLTLGDFWFDTDHNQVYVWNGTAFTLIGGSVSTGASTQMSSILVKDLDSGQNHPIITATVDGHVIFVVSSETYEYTLDTTANPILGFTKIYPGITLVDTNNPNLPGQSAGTARFYGTATDSERLGGLSSGDFIKAGAANFTSTVKFGDPGYTVGTPTKLKVYNDGSGYPTIQSTVSSIPLIFQTTGGAGDTITVAKMVEHDILPGVNLLGNLGSTALTWGTVYANTFTGTANIAVQLKVGIETASASVANVTGNVSIVARDTLGNINVATMTGVATQANSLNLSGTQTYLTASTSATASSIVARDISGNITAGSASLSSVTKTGTTGNGDIGQSNNTFANVYATTFRGNVVGNVTGTVTGSISGNILAGANVGQITTGQALVDVTTNKMRASSMYLGNGTATNPSLSFISDSNQSSGFYWSTNGEINISNNGVYSGKFATGGNLIMTGNMTAVLFQGTATQARYADLAEKYLSDAEYEIGTVVAVGGEKEVTASKFGDRALGAVSANPAYMMNSELEGGTYIALKGRVPVRVSGAVIKGQRLVAFDNGTAVSAPTNSSDVFAIALETNTDFRVKLVECAIL